MNFEKFSLLIIAGGKSSRLGRDKRYVKVGEFGLLENILKKAVKENFAEIFLCVERETVPIQILSWRYEVKILVDKVQGAGPAAGLANGLAKIKTAWALAVSADMPFFEFESLHTMEIFSEVFAIIPTVGGRRQTLAAFYHKALAEVFEKEIQDKQNKILTTIEKVPHKFVELWVDEKIFFNVNTHADLRLAQGRTENLSRKVPIISVVAPCSGTGKTTFIEKLIKILAEENIKVGVIKSDAHSFNLDLEGKDSKKFQNAGAKSVAVVSPQGWFMIQQTEKREDFFVIAEKMYDVDLILTESRTHATQPSLSLWRGKGEVILDDKVAAIFTSNPEKSDEVLQFDLNDINAAAEICKFLMY